MPNKTPSELALAALEREHQRLEKAADKAARAALECGNAPAELIAAHNDLVRLLSRPTRGAAFDIKAIDQAGARHDAAKKLMKKDYLKLLDHEHQARTTAAEFKHLVDELRFYIGRRWQ